MDRAVHCIFKHSSSTGAFQMLCGIAISNIHSRCKQSSNDVCKASSACMLRGQLRGEQRTYTKLVTDNICASDCMVASASSSTRVSSRCLPPNNMSNTHNILRHANLMYLQRRDRKSIAMELKGLSLTLQLRKHVLRAHAL